MAAAAAVEEVAAVVVVLVCGAPRSGLTANRWAQPLRCSRCERPPRAAAPAPVAMVPPRAQAEAALLCLRQWSHSARLVLAVLARSVMSCVRSHGSSAPRVCGARDLGRWWACSWQRRRARARFMRGRRHASAMHSRCQRHRGSCCSSETPSNCLHPSASTRSAMASWQ
jgi:hypothetical protein